MNAETLYDLARERVHDRMREAQEARLALRLRSSTDRRPRLTIALVAHALAMHREAAAR